MKNLLISVFCALVYCQLASAAILLVNNNPQGPGQYTQLDPAIAAANPGDTIYVNASIIAYPATFITKSIVIIGPGAFNQTEIQLAAEVGSIFIDNNVSNIKIIGLKTSGFNLNLKSNIHNLTITNCLITSSIYMSSVTNITNVNIENNIFTNTSSNIDFSGSTVAAGNTAYLIQNNFFHGGMNGLVITNAVVQNNVFLSATNAFIGTTSGLLIQNNIFASSHPSNNVVGSSYNNNLTYHPSITYPILGGTNLDNVDPMFTNVPDFNGYNNTYNYNLQISSPGHNAGMDGTDIGYYGGMLPVSTTGEANNLPVIRKMNIINTNVPQSGNVNVKVRSTKSRTN
jgi:hypothetical protein